MDKKKKKKIMCATAACLVLGAYTYTRKNEYNPNYTILNYEYGPFACYSDGYVYIGDREYLDNLDNISPSDVLVLDDRTDKDPNMEIYNSYLITDKDKRNEILEIICYYEMLYPSEWDRSIESMRLEWYFHNVGYYLNYRASEAKEVDLNNKDEKKYDHEVLRRILRI